MIRSDAFKILVRMVQAFGSSAVLAIGAGSLADMYERAERGTKVRPIMVQSGAPLIFWVGLEQMGIYYAVPLLGPSIGPLAGGILSNVRVYLVGTSAWC